jgi:hypothetical protein
MAQYDKTKQLLRNGNNILYEVQMQADRYGNIVTENVTSRSAFGETLAVPLNPVIQEEAIYGIPKGLEQFTQGTGIVSVVNSKMHIESGVDAYSYAVLRSRRTVRYRPGQGASARFTAKYTDGVDGYTQQAGFFSIESAIVIGYNGTEFGVMRDNGGKIQIQELVITDAATTATDVTWTLAGVPVTATLTVSDIETNIREIIAQIPATWNVEWSLQSNGDGIIRVSSNSIGVLVGSFNFTAGTTGLVATQSAVQEGANGNPSWTPQSEFSIDKLDGTGPSRMIIDTTKLNVFQINFRWLGAGRIQYSIEDGEGIIVPFHTEFYANLNENVSIDDPSMKIGYIVANTDGLGGSNVVVEGASIMGAIEGVINSTQFTLTHQHFLATAGKTVYHHLFTLRNRNSFGNRVNLKEAILKSLSCNVSSTSGNAIATFYIFSNATLSTPKTWRPISEENSILYYSDDVGVIDLASNVAIASFQASSASPVNIDLDSLRIVIPPQNEISIAVIAPSTSNNFNGAGASLNWLED